MIGLIAFSLSGAMTGRKTPSPHYRQVWTRVTRGSVDLQPKVRSNRRPSLPTSLGTLGTLGVDEPCSAEYPHQPGVSPADDVPVNEVISVYSVSLHGISLSSLPAQKKKHRCMTRGRYGDHKDIVRNHVNRCRDLNMKLKVV